MSKREIHPRRTSKSKSRNLSKKWKKPPDLARECAAWRLLNGTIFIFCLIFFIYQSTEFLLLYFKYPTTSKIEFTYPDEFEAPALTFCSGSILKRSKFCEEYPDLCLVDVTEFCKKNSDECKKNNSIPTPNLELELELNSAISEIYNKGNITKEFWEEWTWRIEDWIKEHDKTKPVFVMGMNGFHYPCYTENLLLNSSDEPLIIRIDSIHIMGWMFRYVLNIERTEEFLFPEEPEIFFAVHSPYEPINLLYTGEHLKLGNKYSVFIRMEEKRLLKHPYASNCIDYKDLWIKRNRQGPRSQEMCQELCLHDLFASNKNISPEFQMLEYPLPVCLDHSCQTSFEERKLLDRCAINCKASCRVLKYIINRIDIEPDYFKKKKKGDYDYSKPDNILVEIILGDRQLIVEQHVPVYDTGNLFSYIGGLMGCWLGVSIRDFAAITKRVFRKSLQWTHQIINYLKDTSLRRNIFFSRNRNNVLRLNTS